MDLSLLPPELLPPILNSVTLPLSERIRLRVISKTWRDVIEYGLKKETVLSIYENYKYNPGDDDGDGQAPKNLLQLHHITGPFIDLLGRLFPAVVELEVIIWYTEEAPSSESHLPELLAAFQSTLTSLNLKAGVLSRYVRIGHLARERISSSINALTKLTEFNHNARALRLLPHLAPTLARLERFSATCYVDEEIVKHLSDRCTWLSLPNLIFNDMPPKIVVSSVVDLQNNYIDQFDQDNVSHLVAMFPSVKCFQLKIYPHGPTTATLDALTRLKNLSQLELVNWVYSPEHLTAPSGRTLWKVHQLSLSFWEVNFDWQHLASSLAVWFPGLKKLTIKVRSVDIFNANRHHFSSSLSLSFELMQDWFERRLW